MITPDQLIHQLSEHFIPHITYELEYNSKTIKITHHSNHQPQHYNWNDKIIINTDTKEEIYLDQFIPKLLAEHTQILDQDPTLYPIIKLLQINHIPIRYGTIIILKTTKQAEYLCHIGKNNAQINQDHIIITPIQQPNYPDYHQITLYYSDPNFLTQLKQLT